MNITERKKEILKLLAQGKRPKEIAETFNVSEQAIRNHMRELKLWLRADTSTMLVYEACKQKII